VNGFVIALEGGDEERSTKAGMEEGAINMGKLYTRGGNGKEKSPELVPQVPPTGK